MVNERPKQFGGTHRFGAAPRPGYIRPSSGSATLSASPGVAAAAAVSKPLADPSLRRIARRGGVKRISATIYDDVRLALKARLTAIMKDVIAVVELGGRKTVTVTDIVFVLNRQGHTLYGYDPSFTGSR
ncbi:Nn.00g115170.m01.CDS01 [Neocucurbitaria sp. VM-36]